MSFPASPKPKAEGRKFSLDRVIGGLARLLCSLRLAVAVIVTLSIFLTVATVLESIYDTPTARYWIYDSLPFAATLALLGLNIFSVAVSRWPWKTRHLPFLCAHAGILLILFGSWITRHRGADGSIRIAEGEERAWVELPEMVLHLMDPTGEVASVPIPWVPPGVRFSPIEIPGMQLRVGDFLSHAEPSFRFLPAGPSDADASPAVRLRLQGGPMRISEEVWLWGGDPAWSSIPMGPARFNLFTKAGGDPLKIVPMRDGEARLDLTALPNGNLRWSTLSRRGERKSGEWKKGAIEGRRIDPGWMGMTMTVLEWIPSAKNETSYVASRIQYGEQAPPSAIRLETGRGGPGSELWLGLGDQASFRAKDRDITVTFRRMGIALPFRIALDRFEVKHDPGTRTAAEYRSLVRVKDGGRETEPAWISMNEPLEHGDYTFYQASYEPAEPRPVVTILSVNRDPGRWLKYGGSLLLVLGSIWLFAWKLWKRRRMEGTVA